MVGIARQLLDSLAGLGKSTLRQLTWSRTATATATANWRQLTATHAWGRAEWEIFWCFCWNSGLAVLVGEIQGGRCVRGWAGLNCWCLGSEQGGITVCHSGSGPYCFWRREGPYSCVHLSDSPHTPLALSQPWSLRSLDRYIASSSSLDHRSARQGSDYSTAASVIASPDALCRRRVICRDRQAKPAISVDA